MCRGRVAEFQIKTGLDAEIDLHVKAGLQGCVSR